MAGEFEIRQVEAELALAEWLTRCREGHGESWDAVLRRYPELASELRRLSESGASLRSLPPGGEGWERLLEGDSSLGPQRDRLRAGLRVGRYALQERLGAGGMGVVWRAVDMELGHEVALKFLPEVLSGDAQAMRVLEDEARVLLELTHPNIVRVRNLETWEDTAYLIEEYLEGGTLDQIVSSRVAPGRRGLENSEVLHVLREIADALDMAHAQGVTHRDIKPANLLADRSCRGEFGLLRARIKVADFGLAFVATRSMRERASYRPSGTLPYMAPEVLLGGQPSPKSDVFSLGATLFHLVNGRAPFAGENIPFQVLHREAAPADSGDAALDRAIEAALRKDPAQRPNSVAHLLALAEGASESEGNVQQVPRSGTRVLFAALALTAAAASTWWWKRPLDAAVTDAEANSGHASKLAATSALDGLGAEWNISPMLEFDADSMRERWVVRDTLVLRGRVHAPAERYVIVRVGARESMHRLDAADRFEIVEALPRGECTPEVIAPGATASVRFSALRDDAAPRIDCITPESTDSSTAGASVDLCVRVTDESAVRVRLDERVDLEPVGDGTWRLAGIELTEGETRLMNVVASDESGQSSALTLRIARTYAQPQLTDSNPPLGTTLAHAQRIAVSFDFDEPLRFARLGEIDLTLAADGRRASGFDRPDRFEGRWRRELVVEDLAGTSARFAVEHELFVRAREVEGFETIDATPGWNAFPTRIRDPRNGVIFRLIPPGAFEMGAREDEADFDNAPRHSVRITKPFYLAETELTIAQWSSFVDATQHRTTAEVERNALTRAPLLEPAWRNDPDLDWRPWNRAVDPRTLERPVCLVSWHDARAFNAHFGYQLPSEAQWEYAARAGSQLRYPWGQRSGEFARFANLADAAHAREFGQTKTPTLSDDGFALAAPVASFTPNAFGLHDMLGNVWEWCEDVYAPEVYSERAGEQPCMDPRSIDSRGDLPRVLRGGGFTTNLADSSCAQRAFDFPGQPSDLYGFRPVFEP